MYITWSLVILGSVPPPSGSIDALFDPLEHLRTSSDDVGIWVNSFSAFALLTSFIGALLGLVDYFADAFAKPLGIGVNSVESTEGGKITSTSLTPTPRYTTAQKSILFACALCPPLAIALYDPSLLFAALDYAGIFGDLFLFGMIPVAMVWQQRYGAKDQVDDPFLVPPVLPGGRLTLVLMMGIAGTVFFLEASNLLFGTIGAGL